MNEEKLKEVLCDTFGLDEEEISQNMSNDSIASWDSLNHLRLVSALEQEFDIRLTMEEISSMTNYGKIVEYVGKHLQG